MMIGEDEERSYYKAMLVVTVALAILASVVTIAVVIVEPSGDDAPRPIEPPTAPQPVTVG